VFADGSFASFLEQSLTALRHELPDAYAQLCHQIGARAVRVCVGSERVTLQFEPDRVQVSRTVGPHAVSVRTTKRTILRLVDAQTTLLDAALADDLELVGAPDEILRFHDGLMIYLHGAMRAPSFPDLLRRYRQNAGRARHVKEGA
jgi:hypothetical protein